MALRNTLLAKPRSMTRPPELSALHRRSASASGLGVGFAPAARRLQIHVRGLSRRKFLGNPPGEGQYTPERFQTPPPAADPEAEVREKIGGKGGLARPPRRG